VFFGIFFGICHVSVSCDRRKDSCRELAQKRTFATMKSTEPPKLQPWEEAVAYVSLGVLCGWYYILCIAGPLLVYLSVRGSAVTTTILALLVGSAVMYVPGR
jgi:hypothetical protein